MGVFVRYGFYKTPNDAPGPSRISPPNLNGREPSAAGACQASKRGLGRLEMTKKMEGWCGLPMVNDQYLVVHPT